jgi:hypothetical protein
VIAFIPDSSELNGSVHDGGYGYGELRCQG